VKILLLNAGSSSLKCTLMDSETRGVVGKASADWAGDVTRYQRTGPGQERVSENAPLRGQGDAARRMVRELVHEPVAAVGHRIVHGGQFHSAVRVTPDLRARIVALSELAPLHNPPGLEGLDTAERLLPNVPQVAVFDTAFHATLPPAAYTYPVPRTWTADWGIRRYGFHGLSHSYCAGRAAEFLGRNLRELRVVICHLGHGASATAVFRGQSIDTTMGFTPLDGLMMATRSGALDPGILTYVQTKHGLSAKNVDEALNHSAGLLGVSGLSGDMRVVEAAAAGGNEQARLAIDVYAHRVRQAIGALAVTLGGVDVLVFTAGVGENSPVIRAAVCDGLDCLGLELDPDANAKLHADADISVAGSDARILVLATREDLAMLSDVMQVVAA
jgi:acetate kinase